MVLHGFMTKLALQDRQTLTMSVSLNVEQRVNICLLGEMCWVSRHDDILNKEVRAQDLWLKFLSPPVLKIRSLWLS